MRKPARDLEIGDVVAELGLPITKVDKTTTPGIVYVWTVESVAASIIFNHGEYVTCEPRQTQIGEVS